MTKFAASMAFIMSGIMLSGFSIRNIIYAVVFAMLGYAAMQMKEGK